MAGDAVRERGADAVAHLDMVAEDRDLAVGAELDAAERAVRAGAVVLGDAGDAGADEPIARVCLSCARCCQIGCFSSLSRISGVRTETM